MGQNCVASTTLGCILCYKGCNAEKVRNSFVFLPPKPSYDVLKNDPQDPRKGVITYRMESLAGAALYQQAANSAEVRFVTTRKGENVPVVWIRNKATREARDASRALRETRDPELKSSSSSVESPIVLLHCHGNATDVGLMMGPYFELAKILGVEVLGVEYSGYGCASGEPSSRNNHADLEAAYDLLVNSGVSPSKIIGYGQSIGSGPIASLGCKRQLGGIILHSPLLSGIKVIDPDPERCCRPSCVFTCFDFFRVERSVRNIKCPVFIMHGQRDDIVPFYHGFRLYDVIPQAHRWPAYFPERGGHNDLIEMDMRAYFGEVSNFVEDVRRRANGFRVNPPNSLPEQVEMQGFSLPQSKRNGHDDWFAPAQLQSNDSEKRLLANCADNREDLDLADAGVGHVLEVPVGPTDGRYQAARQGAMRAASRGGNQNARELQMVPKGSGSDTSFKKSASK